MLVCHACDNPRCVNPKHLYLGTAKENTLDMIRKGRKRSATGECSAARLHPESVQRGERHKLAKLTRYKVDTIRALYNSTDVTHAQLAAIYGVSESLIQRVTTWRCWR
jgi:DNA-binding transcriptional regulator YiaG